MMKLAIMQPYFFPYIGYFQLINSVDKFVFYDDVNYIKGGWINRNKLFLAGAVRYITIPLVDASSFRKINKTCVKKDGEWVKKMLSSIDQSYSKAPFYNPVRNLIENVLSDDSENLSVLTKNSVKASADYIGMDIDFIETSEIYGNQEKTGSERVIDICLIEKASEYWNLPGGVRLYGSESFEQHKINLKFVDVSIETYQQDSNEFHSGLSIVDVLMYNQPSRVLQMLNVGGAS